MGKRGSLEDLIDDLEDLERNFDKKMQKKYDDIMAYIILAIGKATAYDTGVSRDIIKNILAELGRSDLQAELDHTIWEFWKVKEKRLEDNATYSFKKSNGRYFIQINDYGFTNQNNGKVSDIHPRKDSRIIPRQVDYGIDLMETESDYDIEMAFKNLESFIVKALDGDI
ncbi:MAG: hypothetical protein ACRC1T_09175 [Clostridium chrysemydis]|uniref:hypothetical protein n=1 Tax=Clostridium chrysemydis TaxID=2665504 RepID=UPI003F2D88EE